VVARGLRWPRRLDGTRARARHNDHVTEHKRPWPGNELALQHGAHSPRHIGPLKDQVVKEILEDPASPAYIQDPSYRLTLEALGRVTAVTILLWSWLERQLEAHDVEALLEDVTRATETEERDGATVTRRSVSQRTESVLNQLRKYETLALHLRQKLGLDPSSRSKMAARILNPHQRDLAMEYMQEQAKASRKRLGV